MCGRYYRRSDKQAIAEHFRVRNDLTDLVLPDADYNVAPTTMQPIIREARDTKDRELLLMRWGLIPFFAKSPKDFGFNTINAKAETLTSRPVWKRNFERHRCIIPANGFYEWKKLDARTKQPYRFDLANGQPFAFAGLWDAWKEPKKSPSEIDHWMQSFTIITTEPNELTAQVHTRMPVILRPSDYDRWLSREITDQPPIDLLRPYPAEEMEMHRANQAVGNVRNNSIEMLDSKEDSNLPLNSA